MNFHLSWYGSLQFRKMYFYVELLQWELYRFLFLLSILTKHFVYVEKTPKILSAFSSFPILLFLQSQTTSRRAPIPPAAGRCTTPV